MTFAACAIVHANSTNVGGARSGLRHVRWLGRFLATRRPTREEELSDGCHAPNRWCGAGRGGQGRHSTWKRWSSTYLPSCR